MIENKIENNKEIIKILLNKQFYSIDAVKEAIIDFEDICIGRIIDDTALADGTIAVELEPKQETESNHGTGQNMETYAQLEGEFCNYVLGLMKNKALI